MLETNSRSSSWRYLTLSFERYTSVHWEHWVQWADESLGSKLKFRHPHELELELFSQIIAVNWAGTKVYELYIYDVGCKYTHEFCNEGGKWYFLCANLPSDRWNRLRRRRGKWARLTLSLAESGWRSSGAFRSGYPHRSGPESEFREGPSNPQVREGPLLQLSRSSCGNVVLQEKQVVTPLLSKKLISKKKLSL